MHLEPMPVHVKGVLNERNLAKVHNCMKANDILQLFQGTAVTAAFIAGNALLIQAAYFVQARMERLPPPPQLQLLEMVGSLPAPQGSKGMNIPVTSTCEILARG